LRATAQSRAAGIVANAKATSFSDADGKIVRINAVAVKTGKRPLISIPLTLSDLRSVSLTARTVVVAGGTRGAKVKSMTQAELDALLAPAPVTEADSGIEQVEEEKATAILSALHGTSGDAPTVKASHK
jgi:hypothetical protein